jgi:hypothetical protein
VPARSPLEKAASEARICAACCGLFVYWAGCTGSIADPTPQGTPGTIEPAATSDSPAGTVTDGSAANGDRAAQPDHCASATIDPGPSPLRLLSREQYLNTIRDLFGDAAQAASALGANRGASAFGLIQADVGQVELENFQQAAELIGAAVVVNQPLLNALAPCRAGADRRGCARDFVRTFGARVYRAPVTDSADIDQHMALYDLGAKTNHEHGLELVLRAMLQAPRFLYRVEIGTRDEVGPRAIKLSGFEVAARLSYALWDTLPDAKLTSAAESGTLSTPAGISSQLAWMLEDAKGRTLVRRFLENWIHLDDLAAVVKDERMFPDWKTSSLRASMRAQAQSFFDYVLGTQDGRLASLLTSPTVFVNKDLGAYYGVSGGDSFQPLKRTDGLSSGLLTLPALLSLMAKPAESSPIYRGKFVREAMLCQQLPGPPANVPRPPEVTPGVSTRERLRQHEVDPACSTCHRIMDPIGFGFESYDAVGRYRTMDGNRPIDARGEVVGTTDLDGTFEGVAELGQKLAASAQVEECVARQWFRFALGRFEQPADECSMKRLTAAFSQSDADLNALPRAIVDSDAFLYRRPLDFEVSP